MPVDPISGAAAPQTNAGSSHAMGQLGSDTFLKLLVAQLRYQNPMQPTDGTAMLQQTAQFTQVETLKQLASAQKELLASNQAALAAGFVGKEVSAVDSLGNPVTGTVESLRFTADGPLLRIGDLELPLEAATEIRLPGAAGAETPSA